MSGITSMAACPGSAGTTIEGSVEGPAQQNLFARLRGMTVPQRTWLNQWVHENHRHERIATGTMAMGMAIFTREMMEMHIQRSPDMRGMLDCLPVAGRSAEGEKFIGWRQKLGTWPTSATPRQS